MTVPSGLHREWDPQNDDAPSEITEDEDMGGNTTVDVKQTHAEDTDDTLTDNESPVPRESKKLKVPHRAKVRDATIDTVINDQKEELPCQWENCDVVSARPRELSSHILQKHSKGAKACKWKDCNFSSEDEADLIPHIRKHANHKPYFCLEADCANDFEDVDETIKHTKANHRENDVQKLQWIGFLNENSLADDDGTRHLPYGSKLALERYTALVDDKDFVEGLSNQKIDFIKIQNVSVDDIVSEPVKKKGRTANAEINVDLRSSFKAKNDKFKAFITEQTQKGFEKYQKSAGTGLASDSDIDSLSNEKLQSLYESYNRQFLWGLEVNELLKKQLSELKQQEAKLWNEKEALLDASITLEIPEDDLSLYK